MNRMTAGLAGLTAILSLSSTVMAVPISINLGPGDGDYGVDGSPSQGLHVQGGANNGPATFGIGQGTYRLSPLGNGAFATGPLTDGMYLIPSSNQILSVDLADGDHLDGGVDWTKINAGPGQFSNLAGTLSIAHSTGDPAFTQAYIPGGLSPIDLNLTLASGGSLDDPIQGGILIITSGDLSPSAVPEPSSLTMSLTALLALFALYLSTKAPRTKEEH